MTMPQMAALAIRMALGDRVGFSQTVMAATAPALIQQALRQGDPDRGLLPSGQVAAIINDLPSSRALIESMVAEAERRLAHASGGAE